MEEIDILVTNYTDKSIKVEGESTKLYIALWKKLGGRYNSKLEGGPGWIFSAKKREDIERLVEDIRSGTAEDPKKVEAKALVDKISKLARDLTPVDRKEVLEHIKATFYFD